MAEAQLNGSSALTTLWAPFKGLGAYEPWHWPNRNWDRLQLNKGRLEQVNRDSSLLAVTTVRKKILCFHKTLVYNLQQTQAPYHSRTLSATALSAKHRRHIPRSPSSRVNKRSTPSHSDAPYGATVAEPESFLIHKPADDIWLRYCWKSYDGASDISGTCSAWSILPDQRRTTSRKVQL